MSPKYRLSIDVNTCTSTAITVHEYTFDKALAFKPFPSFPYLISDSIDESKHMHEVQENHESKSQLDLGDLKAFMNVFLTYFITVSV